MAWIESITNVSRPAWRVGRREAGKKEHSEIFYSYEDAKYKRAEWDLERKATRNPETPLTLLWQKYMRWCVSEKGIGVKTVISRESVGKHGLEYFKSLRDLNVDNTMRWRLWLGERKCKKGINKGDSISLNTVKLVLKTFKGFVKWLVREDYLQKDPMVKLSIGKSVSTGRAYSRRIMKIMDQEARRIKRFYPVYKVLTTTGARLGEVLEKFEWEKLGKDGIVELRKTKNGQSRTIVIMPQVRALLGMPSKGLVFRNYKRSMFYSDWWKVRDNIALKLNLEGKIVPHHFRHTYATHFARLYKDPVALQHAMGWKNSSTADTYIHLTRESLGKMQRDFEFIE